MTEQVHDVVVVGGGISGLTTAWHLQRAGRSLTVLEADPAAGGAMRTSREEGFLVEGGPNSLLENHPAVRDLVQGVGLEDSLQEANRVARRRYVAKEGELHPLPGSPGAFAKTPLFSTRGKLRLFAEPFIGRADSEETVADFVRRRLGREFLDWAIDPFVSGVYAGDPHRLSVRAATPKVYALERDYRSLFIGAIKKMLVNRHRGGAGPSGRMISFEGGAGQLPEAIARSLGDRLQTGVPVDALEKTDEGWLVRAGERQMRARQLVLAVPAAQAARLLRPLDAALADELDAVVYPPVASVALGFRADQVRHPLDGFGFLIPRREGVDTLGSLFSSTLFPGRAPEGHVLLTSFIGGRQNPGVAEMDQDELVEQVRADLAGYLGIDGEPVFRKVNFWPRAIPQYELGHLERMQRVDERLASLPGLELQASYRGGISVPDCIRNAQELAERMSRQPTADG